MTDIVTIVHWNIDRLRKKTNWGAFRVGGLFEACDVALLNEAVPPPPDLASMVKTAGRTIGRDDVSRGGNKVRGWSTAIYSPHGLSHPEDVWSLPPGPEDRRSPMETSREGTWEVATVRIPIWDFPVTLVSVYALFDERIDASVHRTLSDLSPLLDDPRYSRYLILAGDLNTLEAGRLGSRSLAKEQGVLRRITEGFELVDLLQEGLRLNNPNRGRLPGCPCDFGDLCKHTRTFKGGDAATAYQDDYLFASKELSGRLRTCVALESSDLQGDHLPLVATFYREKSREATEE